MAAKHSSALLDSVEGKPLKCELRRAKDSFVRAGEVVDRAIKRAYPKQEAAAVDYGTSSSLLSRQMRNQDDQHLSFQRLWSMPVPFKLALVDELMEDLSADGAPVEGDKVWRIRRSA